MHNAFPALFARLVLLFQCKCVKYVYYSSFLESHLFCSSYFTALRLAANNSCWPLRETKTNRERALSYTRRHNVTGQSYLRNASQTISWIGSLNVSYLSGTTKYLSVPKHFQRYFPVKRNMRALIVNVFSRWK